MRVLVAHNFYRSHLPSGENRVVEDQVRLLRDRGIDVDLLVRRSDDIEDMSTAQRIGLAWQPIYSPSATRELRRRIERSRPDVLVLHNPFPLLSPAIVTVAASAGVPTVQVVHNYRHVCPAGTFFRAGSVCQDCVGRPFPWPAVAHKCYRDSRGQSLVLATALTAHRPTWKKVSRFLAVSEFVAGKLRAAGIADAKIRVVPNGATDPGDPTEPGSGFVFVGRLSPEKGVALLLDAWRVAGLGQDSRLVIVGDGPQRSLVEEAAARDGTIDYRGPCAPEDVGAILDDSAVVVIPSQCFEGFPVLLAQAFARARPAFVSDLGALSDLVDDSVGWRATPVPEQFAAALRAVDRSGVEARSVRARTRYVERYSLDAVTDALIENLEEVATQARTGTL